MTYHPDDTIAAIASPAGGAARGLVRVSGKRAIDVVAECIEPDADAIRQLRQATAVAGRLQIELGDGARPAVPCDLFVWPTRRSYTREPIVEVHTLGSPPLLDAVLAAVCRGGARLAEPGEFTLRAFLAGRLDLTQAEAVLGVIDARGAAELDAALAQLAGGLARPLQHLRRELLQLLAELEAGLDFVDEDIEFISHDALLERLEASAALLRDVDHQMNRRYTVASVHQVVLVGLPNAGKSSLFNALVARTAKTAQRAAHPALVSSLEGTTRDYLAAALELGGVRCELIDTAGIEAAPSMEATAGIDRTAQEFTRQQEERATIRAWCVDVRQARAADLFDPGSLQPESDVVVMTKADLLPGFRTLDSSSPANVRTVFTSSRTGEGLDELAQVLGELLGRESNPRQGQVVSATADRSRESIRLAAAALARAASLADSRGGEELVAVELRAALDELGKVAGAIYTDDLLDRIFKTFCIGK